MVAWLFVACVAFAQPTLSATQAVPVATPTPAGPSLERRLFRVRSPAAWQVVQKRLSELGLATDKVDRENQFTLTKWRDVGAKGMEWLPALQLPEGYVAEQVRFEVFVSPFAEPARVYVGSLMQARKVGSAPGSATVYNVSALNMALMAEIARALGDEGVPIPEDREQRRRLALASLEDEADECLRQGSPPKNARLTPPKRISASVFEPLYPADAVRERKEGSVQVEFTILEDGGVTGVRSLGLPLGHQLERSAMGAASLLLYSPTKLNECRVPTVMTYTVHYRQR